MKRVARARILLLLLAGCGTSSFEMADLYDVYGLDFEQYRRIVVEPVSTSVEDANRNRAEYLGALYRRAFIREIEKGGRVELASAVGPEPSRTLILQINTSDYTRERERLLIPSMEEGKPGRWGYMDGESFEWTWSLREADTGNVVAEGEESGFTVSNGLGGNRLMYTQQSWDWRARIHAELRCVTLGIGPVPVRKKTPLQYTVDVLAIERADVLRVARHLNLERAVDLDAVRFNHGTWGVPGNLDRIPAWESLTPQQRASLDAEVRVQEWFVNAVARGRSLSELARVLRRDAGLSVYTLTRTLPKNAWDLEGSIGPCRIDYTLVEEIERGIEADGSTVGGVRIGGRAELIGAVAVRRIEP